MDAFVAGAWRKAARAEIQAGGQWRRITRGEAYLDGQWRSVVTFTPPFSVSSPIEVFGSRNPQKPTFGTVTAFVGAVPSGGLSPYRYQWSVVSGAVSFSNPNGAGTNISATLPPESEQEGTVRITCTDAAGSVAQSETMFYFVNQSNQ